MNQNEELPIKIWITRGCGGSLTSRGLGNVNVWFQEPCINIYDPNEEMFPLDNSFQDSLFGTLYTRNAKHNFVFRAENDVKSEFGPKLIRNADGIDIPQLLIDLEKERKLRFEFEVFGDGLKTGYRPTKVPLIFGYDSEISAKIWQMILDEFDGVHQLDWSKLNDEKPFWLFCKQMEITMKLKL